MGERQEQGSERKVGRCLGPPVLVAPKLLLKVLAVAVVVPKRGLTLHPVHHLPINCNGHLQFEVWCLVIPPCPQSTLIWKMEEKESCAFLAPLTSQEQVVIYMSHVEVFVTGIKIESSDQKPFW